MRLLLLGFLGLPFLPLVARADVTADVEETRPLTAAGEVIVENINGPVTVESWDKDEVRVVATKKARTQADVDALEVRIDSSEKRLVVKTVYNGKDGNWLKKFTNTGEVRYTLTVPHGANLRKIETVNGAIAIANVHGRVNAKTVNGRIDARGLRHEVEMNVVNGAIRAEFDSVSDKQDIELEAANGGIELRLPADTGAEISASTVNGAISNDFGLDPESDRWVGRELQGTIGDGAARIRLRTVNGSVEIRKR